MEIPDVIGHLNATAEMRAHIFGHDDSSVLTALAMRDAVIKLHNAAKDTLRENRHLADGDNCTLLKLRQALEPEPQG